MNLSQIIESMRNVGIPAEQILEVVQDYESKRADANRAAVRERVRKHRENKALEESSVTDVTDVTLVTVTKETSPSQGSLSPTPPISPNSPPKEKPPKGVKKKKPPLFLSPDWINQQDWEDFLEMRRKSKAPMTKRAAELLVDRLAKLKAQGHSPSKLLQRSILNGWKDVYPEDRSGKPPDVRAKSSGLTGEQLKQMGLK